MELVRKQPLFCITGASCVGKSTACNLLMQQEKDYIVLESDLLWSEQYNTPEDDYRAYRTIWLNLCANISQIGLPCVLCGCCTPKQFERLAQRELFTRIDYLAIVCDDEAMLARMQKGRGVTDKGWIESSLHFNRWLRQNAGTTEPPIQLLDATLLTPQETAKAIDAWIRTSMKGKEG